VTETAEPERAERTWKMERPPYEIHATLGERRVEVGYGSAKYLRCTVYRILDTDSGEWVHTTARKADAHRVAKAMNIQARRLREGIV
jgi:hypothetical protein